MNRLLVSVVFLTRVPVPLRSPVGAREVGQAALFFPLVGAGLGALLALAGRLLATRLPAPLVAVLLVALGALATGAMHLDGLADTADGFGGGRDREDRLRIMRDHAVGAYGATALLLVLLVKAAALAALLAGGASARWLPVAYALSRWVPVPLARWLPSARSGGGLGGGFAEHLGPVELWGATVLALVTAVSLAGWRGAVAFAGCGALAAALGAVCWRRIGGVTGDTLGAGAELAEAAVLVLAVGLG